MYEYGLKLWSVNENYRSEAIRLYKESIYDYIELYIIPDSYNDCIELWKTLKIPFIIHAPHFRNGMNLAKKENLDLNMKLAAETRKFADTLNAESIIYHPGIAGNIEETVKQLNIINDSRIVVENKPYYTVLGDGNICNGYSPEDIKYILNYNKIGFCLDVGHCFCAANAKNIEPFEYLTKFINLNPKIYHLTDNFFDSPIDKHLHFGQGNYDIDKILKFIPENSMITIETIKDSNKNLLDFIKDIGILKNHENIIFN